MAQVPAKRLWKRPAMLVSLMLMVATTGVGCAAPGVRDAIQVVERHGGSVSDDLPWPLSVDFSPDRPHQITDAEFEEVSVALRAFPTMTTLELSGQGITDKSIPGIERSKSLETLILDDTRLTAGGLLQLKKMQHLRRISIHGGQLSQDDVARVRSGMPGVTVEVWANVPCSSNGINAQN